MRALAIVLLLGATASAQDLADRFNYRVSLSAMYLHESQSDVAQLGSIAGPLSLAYGDLRVVFDARKLPASFELHLDGRVRVTGSYSTDEADDGSGQTTARGYLGGREYQLTELYARGRWAKADLAFGRMIVGEADALRVDGVRLWLHVHKRWDVSLYGGGYSDPYSRSLDTDYVSGAPAFVAGVSARYQYDKVYGAFSANGAYLHPEQGGAFDPNSPTTTSQTPAQRIYFTWSNFWRPWRFLDVYHDLVVDVDGPAAAQLTRLDAFAAIHVDKHVTIRLGYDHMSAIAIELYLARLLANRTEFVPGSIENNLALSRTARDEGRLTLEMSFGRVTMMLDGRIRRRVLAPPVDDPQFVYPQGVANAGSQVAPTGGQEGTFSIRDRGSLWSLRPSVWVTYLSDYRTRDIFVGLGLGRELLHDALSIDLSFIYANVHDATDSSTTCASSLLPAALQSCFGTRRGNNYEANITVGGTPFRHWFAFIDYRAGIATSDDAPSPLTGMTTPIPAVITHVLLGRIEARY